MKHNGWPVKPRNNGKPVGAKNAATLIISKKKKLLNLLASSTVQSCGPRS